MRERERDALKDKAFFAIQETEDIEDLISIRRDFILPNKLSELEVMVERKIARIFLSSPYIEKIIAVLKNEEYKCLSDNHHSVRNIGH